MSKYLPPSINLPLTYQKQPHPSITFNNKCTKCSLGDRLQRHNLEQDKSPSSKANYTKDKAKFFSVSGVGPDDFDNVKLIVLSDFPGYYESHEDNLFNMVDILQNQNTRGKNGLLLKRNAGSFLRMSLNLMYGLDTYTDCWITNAIKCYPLDNKINELTHLKPCVNTWLANEFSIIESVCPSVPILVAGTLAFKALSYLFPDNKNLLSEYGFNGSRRRPDLKLNSHGIVVTNNPARIARSEPRIETSVSHSKLKLSVSSNDWLYPPIPGSPVDLFIKDLQFLSLYL